MTLWTPWTLPEEEEVSINQDTLSPLSHIFFILFVLFFLLMLCKYHCVSHFHLQVEIEAHLLKEVTYHIYLVDDSQVGVFC